MSTRTATLEADLATIPGASGSTVVALPPSSLDVAGLMRVRINGVEITRAYDSGMAPRVPVLSDVVGRVVDYDADQFVGFADAAAISSMSTTVGSDTLTQATSSAQPTKRTVSGLPVVRFDGGDNLKFATGAHALPMTTFVVAKLNVTTGSPLLTDTGAGTTYSHAIGGTTTNFQMLAGASLLGPALNTAWHIFVAVFNGASSKFRVDGGAGTAGNAGTGTRTGMTLGAASNAANRAQADLRRVISYDRLLTVDDINIVGAALAAHSPGLVTWTTAT